MDRRIEKPPIGAPCNACGLCCQIQVCGTGSYALGLTLELGERVKGPCPALERTSKGYECGVILRPKHYLPHNPRSVTAIRNAMMLCIGYGIGCDEAGDEPDASAQPKIKRIQQEYLRRHSETDLRKAVRIVTDRRS